jgi:alpha-L-fucosidase 2
MQGRVGEIDLLPAVPKVWLSGIVNRLRARGASEVDIVWRDGSPAEAAVRSLKGGTTQLRQGSARCAIQLAKGNADRRNGL